MQFIIRWLATAVAVGAAVWLVPGIAVLGTTESWIAVAITGLALSLIDMSIKPLLQLLSLPITCLTFGIFYLVVNTAMLYLAAWLSNGMFNVGFYISSFGSAFSRPSSSASCPHHELHRRRQLGERVRASMRSDAAPAITLLPRSSPKQAKPAVARASSKTNQAALSHIKF